MAIGRTPRNHLLASLDERDRSRLVRHLEPVHLERDRSLHEPGRPIRAVFLPETALVSISVSMHDGQVTEVASVGRDSMVGVEAGIDAPHTVAHAVVRVSGEATAIPAQVVAAEARRSDTLRRVLQHHAAAALEQALQSVACSRLHLLDQRAARWLLHAQDRLGIDTFPLTQESLATMLGVTRPAVSTVAAGFAREGLAEFRRGTVRVIDREGLLERSCECYDVIVETVTAITGWDPDAVPASRTAIPQPRLSQGRCNAYSPRLTTRTLQRGR